MKNYIASISLTLIAGSSISFAALGPNNSCPDLAGTYKTEDGATFSMTSKESSDGIASFGYDRDTWVADGQERDSHNGSLNPQECPSRIKCNNKILVRTYTCSGFGSVEKYKLDNKGNIEVEGTGMGLNGKHLYTRISN
ncbi:MAG: hypothetical protein ACXWRE_16130 [Pseudobdellovibrionaceae bacterium]